MKAGIPATGARVRDVMTEAVMFLSANQSQDEASAILRVHGVSGAPVLGRKGRLVGVVALSDLADPRRRSPATAGTVEDAMTRTVFAVRAGDPVMSAVHLMIDQDIHRAVVVNDDGGIAGIVAPMDVLRALARGVDLRDPRVEGTTVEYIDLRQLRSSG